MNCLGQTLISGADSGLDCLLGRRELADSGMGRCQSVGRSWGLVPAQLAAPHEPLSCGVARGVTTVQYSPCGEQVASISGNESRSIVAFEGQWRAVVPKG